MKTESTLLGITEQYNEIKMDKLKIKQIVLSVINGHAMQATSKYTNYVSDWFIRDTDKKFEKIADEIANKICDVDDGKN